MKNVVIVEKIKTIRDGIKILINSFSNFESVHSFESLDKYNSSLDSIETDVLLLDFQQKGTSIVDEIRKLKIRYPKMVIVLLIMNEENERIFDALANGATTYVHKNAPAQKLVKVIEDAVGGMITVNSFISRKTLNYIYEKKITDVFNKDEIKLLTKITEGNNTFAIEKSLKMSCDEIKSSFKMIYEKTFNQTYLPQK
jgi:DNA-binding NarL/FixJ family response regulator